jgi:hypothetical protein
MSEPPLVTPLESFEAWSRRTTVSIKIHATIPAPAEAVQDAAQADKRPSWLRTMRRDGKPRWRTNRRSSR